MLTNLMVVLGRRHRIRERDETGKRGTWEVSKEVWIWVSKEITFGFWTPLMGPVRPLYFASCVYQHQNLQSLFFFKKH